MESYMKIMVCADVATYKIADQVDAEYCKPLLVDMKPVLDSVDFRIANLECVLCDKGVGENIIKSGPNLRGEPKNAAFLTEAGIDCAVLANNHLGDLGEPAVCATLDLLNKLNIAYVGGGRNITEAYRAWYAEKDGVKVAFLAVCENEFGGATDSKAGAAVFSMKRLCDRITEEKQTSDFVVVLFHGGNEYDPIPSPETVDRYRLIIDMGADALVAGHTHCMQGFETYRDKPIVYSMGNFFFPSLTTAKEKDPWNFGYMTELTICKGKNITFRVIPYELKDETRWLHVLDGEEKQTILGYLDRLSAIIKEPAEVQRLFDAWCTKAGANYARALVHNPEYLEGDLSEELAKKQANLRNLFWCEAHNTLMRGLMRLEYEGRLDEARASLPELLELQKIPE